jgi:serine/threonine protein kinase
MSTTADPLATFIENLTQSGILTPEQAEELPSVSTQASDPKELAKLLVSKGWLTTYQVKQIWNGMGNDLMFGPYVLLHRVGEGSMGVVFKARHRKMERDVALKVIKADRLTSPEAARRFQREIRAGSVLAHPNIVMAYDADKVGDKHFFAMEYVEGIDLAVIVKQRGPLPIPEACEYIRQAADGLQHAHEAGLVHRDIKPGNMLVANRPPVGEDGLVNTTVGVGMLKILDMGLARITEAAPGMGPSMMTQQGVVIGTPDYLAPEQARNPSKVDIRADIYSLGCTTFFLLTGRVLYPEGTPTEKLLKHFMEPIPDITAFRNDLPPLLVKIVRKMLAKKPEERFQTPAEVAVAVAGFCPGGTPPSDDLLDEPPAPAPAAVAAPASEPAILNPADLPSTVLPKFTDAVVKSASAPELRAPVMAPNRGNTLMIVGIIAFLLVAIVAGYVIATVLMNKP